MRSSLLIRLHGDAEQHASWATFTADGQLINSAIHVPLNTVPHHNRAPFVLIPGTDVILTQAKIPSKQWQRIIQAIPYALEEQLAEEVENLHFVPGKRQPSTDEIPVAVIARTRMATYLQQLDAAGLTPTILMPDILAVPKPAEGWGILYLENEIVLVRTGLTAGFAIETNCLGIALQQALLEAQAAPPQHLVVFNGIQPAMGLTDLHALGIPVTEKNHESGVFAWLTQGVIANKPLNLLQGDYRHQDKLASWWQPWRLTAILLILWGGLYLAKQGVEYQHLKQQRQALKTQIEKIYRETFPQARKIINPRVQMEQQLTALRTQQGQKTQNHTFLALLNKISTPLTRTPGFNLKRIDFRQGRFDIQLTVANLQALESLKQQLSRLNLKVEIQSATSRQGQVESRLRIQSNR